MGGMGLKMIPMLVRHFLARPVWALGHSNWIISFPLTAHIPTWHPHIFYSDRKPFYCNLYTNMSAFLTKSEFLASINFVCLHISIMVSIANLIIKLNSNIR